jgi:hypothetical protein
MLNRALAFIAAATFSLAALASPDAFEGHDYERLKKPQAVSTGKKIEVLEFFWYRCPHCFPARAVARILAEKAAQGCTGAPRARRVP